ncbi:MAG: endolytic transglycosylase MltG [Chloroflexi bacterium]|nr:endolytic transglycosylase MltG [Chloroflexota bacterium]
MTGKRLTTIFILIIFVAVLLLGSAYIFLIAIPTRVAELYGAPASGLGIGTVSRYAWLLYTNQAELLKGTDEASPETLEIKINAGDDASVISTNLAAVGLIPDEEIFLKYLIYKGYDSILQSGSYSFSGAQSAVEIAAMMIDPTPEDVDFVILPGMRYTEIAALIPTAGLDFSADELLALFESGEGLIMPAIFQGAENLEGLILAGDYVIPRSVSAVEFLQALIDQTAAQFTPEVIGAFSQQGLDAYQAITLASIVEKEAIRAEEKSAIVSVFLNRLRVGMPLQSDPTVQYALGWDGASQSWWKSPLAAADLAVSSPYNTYIYGGLTPTPICSVSIDSLIAVAFPQQSDYFYFRSACDGSGYHVFAQSYAEHQSNACP